MHMSMCPGAAQGPSRSSLSALRHSDLTLMWIRVRVSKSPQSILLHREYASCLIHLSSQVIVTQGLYYPIHLTQIHSYKTGEGESTLIHGRNYSNEANPETADPSSVSIRMFNPTWIEMERGQFWQMLQVWWLFRKYVSASSFLYLYHSIYGPEGHCTKGGMAEDSNNVGMLREHLQVTLIFIGETIMQRKSQR